MVPSFEIGLNVLNPNASAFQLQGVVYTVSIQGHDVVKGVGKDFPVVEGYSEETIKLTAAANLFAGVRLVMDLMRSPGENLEFEFEAKLDTGGFGRSIRIKEKGSFRLDGRTEPPGANLTAPPLEKEAELSTGK
jgi:LEA14-like dessication related protein